MRPPHPGPIFEDSTATLVQQRPAPRPLGALVRVFGCSSSPSQLQLHAGSCVLGSAPDANIVLLEPTVSRRHVRLSLVPEGVLVEDLHSHNGVFYMGHRVERMVLSFGGRIELGSATVAIDIDAESLGGELGLYTADTYRGIVGPSAAMRGLFAVMERLEGSLVTALIEGESGVGKELIASALHQGSSVSGGPYVAVNCGAIAPDLVSSELFGHRRGAFTGAIEARAGAFSSADGGTLFLDEVGELPVHVQPMLLRALETGEIRPVGDDRPRRVKARVVAATNRTLEEEIAAGRFRQDLFYRLAVVRLQVPPLRERPEDIEALAAHFARGLGLAEIPGPMLDQLKSRSWTGNVRELRNAMEAYAALGSLPATTIPGGDAGLDSSLRQQVDLTRPYAEQKETLVERFTALYLEQLLDHCGGNQTKAAEIAGLGRGYLGRLVAKYGVGAKTRRK